MTGRRKILISNDDGIHAKGLAALVEIAKEFGGQYDGWGCMSYLFEYEEDEE